MIDTPSVKMACPFCKKREVEWVVTEEGKSFVATAPCCGRRVYGNSEIELDQNLRSLDAGFRRQFPEELGYR